MHVVKQGDQPIEEWEGSLSVTAKGIPEATTGNAIIILSNHRDWRGIRYNKFTQTTTVHNPPKIPGFALPKPELDDYCAAYIGQWLAKSQQIKLKEGDIIKAADAAGKQPMRAYHPVREYLEGLKWDGKNRISTWLSDLLAVKGSSYSSAVGRMWLISAVARVMEPGCQADHMLLFEGAQGFGKSSALRALVGDEWFFDSRLDLGSVDGYQVLRGKWILEAAELDSFKGREATRVKSFITSRVDTFRKSYGKASQDVARQCVIAGSTNEIYYLNDPSGNRRFWPVKIQRKISVKAVADARDQLWAEAYSQFMDGKTWHITEPSLLKTAEEEQQRREIEHPWEGIVAAWVKTNRSLVDNGVTIEDIFKDALLIDRKDMGNHGTAAKVSAILSKLGLAVRDGEENIRPRKYYLKDVSE